MLLAIDTETTGNRVPAGDRPYYVSTCTEEGEIRSWQFDVDPLTRKPLLSPKKTKELQQYIRRFTGYVFHNAKFDIPMLESIDVIVELDKVEDTLLASHVLDNRGSHKLKDLCLLYLDIDTEDEKEFVEAVSKARKIAKKLGWKIARHDHEGEDGENWMKVDGWLLKALFDAKQLSPEQRHWPELLARYGNTDAERAMALWLIFQESLKEQGFWEAYQLQKQVLAPIITMEQRGVSLNPYVFTSRKDYYEIRCHVLTEELQALSGKPDYNPSSGPQTAKILFEDRMLPVVSRTKKSGKPSTDIATLKHLYRIESQDDFLGKLMAFKKNAKTYSDLRSYENFRIGWRLHSAFNPVGTDTTRFSSSSPNLQNIKKGDSVDEVYGEVSEDRYQIREVFGPAEDRLWLDFDYSQLQLRIFAAISQETRMIEAFDQGWDAHDFMACQIYKVDKPDSLQRRTAKNVNFGFIFGAQEERITEVCGDPEVWPTVNSLFPNATKFLETTAVQVRKTGYVELGQPVCTYRLKVPVDPKRGNKPKAYTGVCYKVQGLEGLIVKRALNLWDSRLKAENNDSFLSLQVHDQLIADIPADQPMSSVLNLAKDLKKLMEQAGAEFGVKTPADACLVRGSWTNSEALSL